MSDSRFSHIAVVIPCYNEAASIGLVVRDFSRSLPGAPIYVLDNNSTDATGSEALAAGALVRRVGMQGKGNVVRQAFADIEADIYVMVDGDNTYDAAQAPMLVAQLGDEGLDMLVGARVSDEQSAYRFGHRFGNVVLTQCVASIFGQHFTDMLSGYRIFSRRYVKSFPAHASGFETETELTVHALELRMPVAEVATAYGSRLEGSVSKLNTYRDGIRIFLMIFKLVKLEKPLAFFSTGFVICALIALALAAPLVQTYLQTGLVPRLPTALLCVALTLFGTILLACGLILDTVTRGRIEAKRFAYLAVPASPWKRGPAPAQREC